MRTWIDAVNDGVLLRGIEVRGLEHHAIEIGLAVTGFDFYGDGRNPAGGEKFADVLLGDFHRELALGGADYGRLRLGRRGVRVNEVAAIG